MALVDIATLGPQPTAARGKHTGALGKADLRFAQQADVDEFADKLAAFERGELGPDEWRAFRLVNGAYGQRQDGDYSMLRVKIPQGVLSRPQLDALADVSTRFARGWAHVTTRQNIQYHFLRLGQVEEVMRLLADVGLTCREACGNAVRSITGSPTAGIAADEAFDVTPYGVALTDYFLGHPLAATLPRKFKIAFAGGGADHSFANVNDIGWHARIVDGKRAFRVTVAGGTATLTSSGKVLFDALPAGDIFGVAEAILRVFHRDGNRVNRAKNRMKYLIKELGWDTWHARFKETYALVLAEGAAPLPFDPEAAPVWAVPPSFELPCAAFGSTLHYTGPFLDEHVGEVPFPWQRLDGRPLVYVSLGTLRNRVASVFQAVATACATLDAQTVISLGAWQGDAPALDLSPAITVPYAPQRALLKRAAVCVSHGGANTVFEALAAGVPQVILPITDDQPANAPVRPSRAR